MHGQHQEWIQDGNQTFAFDSQEFDRRFYRLLDRIQPLPFGFPVRENPLQSEIPDLIHPEMIVRFHPGIISK